MCVGMTTQSSSSVIRGKVVFGSKLLQLPFLHGLLVLHASSGVHGRWF